MYSLPGTVEKNTAEDDKDSSVCSPSYIQYVSLEEKRNSNRIF